MADDAGKPDSRPQESVDAPSDNRDAQPRKEFNWSRFNATTDLIFTFIITAATVTNVWIAAHQWNAMQENNAIAQGALAATFADRRPWVSVKLSVTSPLVFRENKDVVVPFNVTLKNVGNSPARNVVERFEVQVLEQDKVFDA